MLIGYCRISTREQNLDRQIESLKEYGCERIYADKASGKNFNRPQYNLMKQVLREGDILVVHEFDRLGRNKKLTLREIQYFRDNNIRLIALNIPTTQMNTNDNVMLETINNIVIELYTMLAQQEIEIREKRQAEGIRIAKEKGVKFGRPSIEIDKNFIRVMQMLEDEEINNIEAMTLLNMKKTTYYKLKKIYLRNLSKNVAIVVQNVV